MRTDKDSQLGYEAFLEGRMPIILLPLDGSEQALSALPLTKLLGRILEAVVHIVRVSEETLSPEELARRLRLEKENLIEAIFEQIKGQPAQAIVQYAVDKKVMLIAMSLRGSNTPPEAIFGPIVRQVIQDAPCPVLLVRPEIATEVRTMSEITRILLPLDGTPSTAGVIGPAHELAHRTNAELDFLYVLEPGGKVPQEPGTLTSPRYMDQPQHEWPAWTEEFMERFCACPPGPYRPAASMRLFFKTGKPSQEILDFAEAQNIDLIVLEWRGQLDPNHALVVQGVLRNALVPVLLLRTKNERTPNDK